MPCLRRTVMIWICTWISASMLMFIQSMFIPHLNTYGLILDIVFTSPFWEILMIAGGAIMTMPMLVLNYLSCLALKKINSKSEIYNAGLILLFSFLSTSLNFSLFLPFYLETPLWFIAHIWPYFLSGMASCLYFFRDIAFEKYARLENPFTKPLPDDREEEF